MHHGIALEDYSFNPPPAGYLAFLGRISPEKGLDTAVRVAQGGAAAEDRRPHAAAVPG